MQDTAVESSSAASSRICFVQYDKNFDGLAQRDIEFLIHTADAYSIDFYKFIREYKKWLLFQVERKARVSLLRRKEAGRALQTSFVLHVGLIKIDSAWLASCSFFIGFSSNRTKTTEIKSERNKNDAQFS